MEIVVKRLWPREKYVIGRMFIDGELYCNTLEDTDRGLDQKQSLAEIAKKKVYSKTAIPTGRYKVGVTYWSKYQINVPYLVGVPGYTGILIHNGTDENSTLGCILVGENKVKGKLINGRKYMHELTAKVQQARRNGEEVWITIQRGE